MANNSLNKIEYKNVYFRTYRFPFRMFNEVIEDFNNRIKEAGIEADGMFFYALEDMIRHNDEEADMIITMYQPAKSYIEVDEEELEFLDAFVYTDLAYRVLENNFETQTERAIYEIIQEAKSKGMSVDSPFFHEFRTQKDSEGKTRVICIIKAHFGTVLEDDNNG